MITKIDDFIKRVESTADEDFFTPTFYRLSSSMFHEMCELLKEQEAVKPYPFEDIWKCGNCGDGVVAYEELGVSGIEEVKFDYCPTCGRRVLWEGR